MRLRLRAAGLALLTGTALVLSGCANIPENSTPQAVPNEGGAKTPGPVLAQPNPDANPLDLVRDFVNAAGDPEVAKAYLTPEGRDEWPADAPPTIIDSTFVTAPIPIQERKLQGDEQTNEATVVLTVANVGRLGLDRAFVPVVGSAEHRVVLRRASPSDPWRIHAPPDVVLITLPTFNQAYQPVRVYFFDPEFRVSVPDLRYVAASPVPGVPDRVIRLLLNGPSDTLKEAVKSMLDPAAEMRTNAVAGPDGALTVNLTKLGDPTPDQRQLIAAQIVLSLRDVRQTPVRLLVDGSPLVPGHGDWRLSDLPSYDAPTKPNAELLGLFTRDGRVYSLKDTQPIQGPAGDGEVTVASAAQSLDGKTLAVVQEVPTGARLRIGPFGGALAEVDLHASTLTRPTWTANEVWTVQNGVDVVRLLRTASGDWSPSPVNAGALKSFGTITDLRLSRDGVRVAIVASGHVVVASVVRARDSVTIHNPRTLQGGNITNVVGVDWRTQDTVVVATAQSAQPVINVPVDGFSLERYNPGNLASPVTAVAAAADRDVVVTDRVGMWTASAIDQVWHLDTQHQIPNARPFYPG